MRAAFVIPALTLALLAACGGGGNDPTATPTSSQTLGPVSSATASTSAKTATPVKVTATVAITPPGETPTAPPVSTEGTPAARPDDEEAFLAQFQGIQTDLSNCSYNPGTAIATCIGEVTYALDPPVVGQDVQCTLWKVEGTPRALACSSVEPPATHYFEIG